VSCTDRNLLCSPSYALQCHHDRSRTGKGRGRIPNIIHVYAHEHARARERHSTAKPYRLGNACSSHVLCARTPWP
jgi:hypothetical protein